MRIEVLIDAYDEFLCPSYRGTLRRVMALAKHHAKKIIV